VANAEAAFRCEHDLKVLNLKMKKVKENMVSQQIELLCLQIQLQGMNQPSSLSSVFPSGPTSNLPANQPGA